MDKRRLSAGAWRHGRTPTAVLAFLLLFAIVLVTVSKIYLLPAMAVVKDASPQERARLGAVSRLMLAVVLFVLLMGLMMTFRVGRFFFPRSRGPRVQTKYVDVWAEAGKRIAPEEPEEPGEPEEMQEE